MPHARLGQVYTMGARLRATSFSKSGAAKRRAHRRGCGSDENLLAIRAASFTKARRLSRTVS